MSPPASTMRVARLYDVDDIRVEEMDVPSVGEREILVKTVACGICTGDIVPWYIRRKAPVVFGHEPVGVVARVGRAVRDFQVGDRVFVHHHAPCFHCRFCRRGRYSLCATWRRSKIVPGGLAEYFLVPEENVTDTLKLPNALSWEDGVLIEPTACVVKSLRRAELHPGETVVVIGLGIMGLLHLRLARALGARRLIGVDRLDARCRVAEQFGDVRTVNAAREPVPERVRELTEGEGADVVIVGPGSCEAIALGIACAGPGGRVILFAPTPPEEQLAIEPYPLYMNEVSLIPSYSCGPPDTREALRWIERGAIRARDLPLRRFSLERVSEAFQAMARAEILKAIICFDPALLAEADAHR
ncbi:Sorbitol dehydrogenase [bacterium HR10]|nr:Sorbitol dehydrogenase [bacterium HR10]